MSQPHQCPSCLQYWQPHEELAGVHTCSGYQPVIPDPRDATIAQLRKELEEANEAVIAAHMLGFEKGKDAAKAELAEARKVIEELVTLKDMRLHHFQDGLWNSIAVAREYETRQPRAWEAARAFLAAEETKG